MIKLTLRAGSLSLKSGLMSLIKSSWKVLDLLDASLCRWLDASLLPLPPCWRLEIFSSDTAAVTPLRDTKQIHMAQHYGSLSLFHNIQRGGTPNIYFSPSIPDAGGKWLLTQSICDTDVTLLRPVVYHTGSLCIRVIVCCNVNKYRCFINQHEHIRHS